MWNVWRGSLSGRRVSLPNGETVVVSGRELIWLYTRPDHEVIAVELIVDTSRISDDEAGALVVRIAATNG